MTCSAWSRSACRQHGEGGGRLQQLRPAVVHLPQNQTFMNRFHVTMPQGEETKEVLSMVVLRLSSQHGGSDGGGRLPQLLAAVIHLQYVSVTGAAPPPQSPTLPAKTEVCLFCLLEPMIT